MDKFIEGTCQRDFVDTMVIHYNVGQEAYYHEAYEF